jgi:hypothetical protein
MKTSELQLGDWVSCLGDPVRVASLILKDKKHIGIMSPLKNIYMYKKKDIKPISLTADILIDNRFGQDTIGSGLILHIDNSENLYVLVNYRYNGECRNVEISNRMYNLSRPIRYVHELQHSLRLCGLSELADNLKI